jgi:hypothetical protein
VSELKGRTSHREIIHHIGELVSKLHVLKSEISEQVDNTSEAAVSIIVQESAEVRAEHETVSEITGRAAEYPRGYSAATDEGQSKKKGIDLVVNAVGEADGRTSVARTSNQDTVTEDGEAVDENRSAVPIYTIDDGDMDRFRATGDALVSEDKSANIEETAKASDGYVTDVTNDDTTPDRSPTQRANDRW